MFLFVRMWPGMGGNCLPIDSSNGVVTSDRNSFKILVGTLHVFFFFFKTSYTRWSGRWGCPQGSEIFIFNHPITFFKYWLLNYHWIITIPSASYQLNPCNLHIIKACCIILIYFASHTPFLFCPICFVWISLINMPCTFADKKLLDTNLLRGKGLLLKQECKTFHRGAIFYKSVAICS